MRVGLRVTLLLLMVYSLQGKRCYGKKEFKHKISVSKIAALRKRTDSLLLLFLPVIIVTLMAMIRKLLLHGKYIILKKYNYDFTVNTDTSPNRWFIRYIVKSLI